MNTRKRKLGKRREENEQQNNKKFSIHKTVSFQILRTHCPTQWWKSFSLKRRGTWLVQSVECATLDFRVISSNTTLGVESTLKNK